MEKIKVEHESINKKLRKIDKEIDQIEVEISILSQRKAELVEIRDQLKEEKMVKRSLEISTQDWSHETFPWSAKVRETLKKSFKMDKFRPQQLKTINAIMSNNDVLLLAPTGGGKSLCFQLPAIISDGLTLVISPLISLMEDQIWGLKRLGIEATLLCSTTNPATTTIILKQIIDKTDNCPIKILYVTPERLAKSKRFMTALQKCYQAKKLDRIAIDEVHCCSQWGHDFRPDYKFLGTLKLIFPSIPILGVTATATSKVIIDVQKMLNIRDSLILRAPFNRPNLYYQVMEKPNEKESVIDLLEELLLHRYEGESGIIYTFSIRDAEDITTGLLKRNCKVRAYHSNLDADIRTKVHSKWLKGEIQAVIATVAFGMGIDKSNVRFVIHHTMSKSIENFYQESGRAGRDGKPAECILLYRFNDIFKTTTMMFSENTGLKNAYDMVSYCIDGMKCRRDLLSKHFSEVWNTSDCRKMCDRCFNIDKVIPPKMNITEYCRELYKIIEQANGIDMKLTGIKLLDAWYHKGASNLRLAAITPPKIDRYYAEQIVAYLLIKGYLREDFHFTPYATNSYIKKGAQGMQDSTIIEFQGARAYDLPDKSYTFEFQKHIVSEHIEEDIVFVSENKTPSKAIMTKSGIKRSTEAESSHSKSNKKTKKSYSKYDTTPNQKASKDKNSSKTSEETDNSSDEENLSFSGNNSKDIEQSINTLNGLLKEVLDSKKQEKCNRNDEITILENVEDVIEIDD